VQVDVNLVWPSAERPWITAYTVGVSSRPMTVPPVARSQFSPYAELFLRLAAVVGARAGVRVLRPPPGERDPLCDPRTARPFEWLALLAGLPHAEKTFLDLDTSSSSTGEESRSDRSPFAGFYLDAGWDEIGDARSRRSCGPPASASTSSCRPPLRGGTASDARGRGKDVLSALDAARVTELFDPGRPCCVPGGC